MICRESLADPNQDGTYSLDDGRNDPNPEWCDCRQGECLIAAAAPEERE